jgi:hypothetical protein
MRAVCDSPILPIKFRTIDESRDEKRVKKGEKVRVGKSILGTILKPIRVVQSQLRTTYRSNSNILYVNTILISVYTFKLADIRTELLS